MAKAHQMVQDRRPLKCNKRNLFFLLVSVLVFALIYMATRSGRQLYDQTKLIDTNHQNSGCDLFSGKWIYDNKSYPLYKEQHCFYQFDGVACEKAGRNDIKYQNWRWQPHQCDLPRFNALAMLERLRNKRLVFVGDGIGRNQWASLLCLLESWVPQSLRSVLPEGSLATFNIKEYNASIEHYWAPFLVESSSDDPLGYHFAKEHIVRVEAIEKHAVHWVNADILIFNSYIWWKKPNLKILQKTVGGSEKEIDRLFGFEILLKEWINWLDINIDRGRTKLFFSTMSPTHESDEKWGKNMGGNCYNESEPITKEGYRKSEIDFAMTRKILHAKEELRRRGLNVQFLNITELSEYRKDGHTSIYSKQWNPVTRQQLENPSSYAECGKWCLPGVPDIWNEILFAYLVSF